MPSLAHSTDPGASSTRTRTLTAVVRVQLVNGRTLWLRDLAVDDEEWLRGTNSRGRGILLVHRLTSSPLMTSRIAHTTVDCRDAFEGSPLSGPAVMRVLVVVG